MNRILFEKFEISADGTVRLTDERAEHIRTVLHGTPGQPLKTGIVDGPICIAKILAIDAAAVTLSIPPLPEAAPSTGRARCPQRAALGASEPWSASLPPWIDLILAVPRPRVLKRLLPQVTSLGVGRIFLVGAEKVEKSYWGAQCLNPELYRPLLVEGLMQAGTTALPTITVAKNFHAFMTRGDFDAAFSAQPLRLVAHPGAHDPLFMTHDSLRNQPSSRPVLAVGPEGGWTDAEVALLESKGFARFSLGPRILRTDTATIALLSVLAARFGC